MTGVVDANVFDIAGNLFLSAKETALVDVFVALGQSLAVNHCNRDLTV